MATSQNGWEVVYINEANSTKLRLWKVPGTTITMRVRSGPAGFLLAHCTTWFHQKVEPLTPIGDEHGWSFRRISGSTEYSNHASGTAVDLNSLKHPQGQDPARSFTDDQITEIHNLMSDVYQGKLRWGGDYRTTKDGMHFEINAPYGEIATLGKKVAVTELGETVRKANKPVVWRDW
jgi:D-alanyl-D-alanine carboxypeptidase